MDAKKDIIDQTRKLQEFILEKYTKSESGKSISNQEIRLINEALSAINCVVDHCNYEPHNKVILQKTYRLGLDIVYEKLFYYAGFYYSYAKISKGDLHEQQLAFFQINVDTATSISVFEGYRNNVNGIGGSTDDYYIERLPRVLWALESVLKFKREELFIPSLYVVYNLSQSLSLYLKSGHKSYKDTIEKLLNDVLKLQDRFHSLEKIQQVLTENVQLDLFRLYQLSISDEALSKGKKKYKLDVPVLKDFKSENTLRILGTVFFFDKNLFVNLFEQKYSDIIEEISKQKTGLNNFLFIKCLSQYLTCQNDTEIIEFSLLSLQKDKIDFSQYIDCVFRQK